jgi:YVTN family beta-propeller protein
VGKRAFAWSASLMAAVAIVQSACGTTPPRQVGEPAPATSLAVAPTGRLVYVGGSPEGIAVDPGRGLIAVAVRGPDAIVILDRSGAIVRRITLPSSARHLRYASPSGALLVPVERLQELIEVDVESGTTASSVKVGRQPHDAVASGDRVFVINEFSDTVSVIEAGKVVASIPAPQQPGGIAASDGELVVVGVRSHTLGLIDATSLARLATVPAGKGPTHVVGAPGGRFFVADTVGNALLAFNTSPALRMIGRVPLAGTPYGLAIDSLHQRLFVTLTARNQVVAYDISGPLPTELGRFGTPRQPNSLAVHPASATVFVTGTADGMVQIVASFS